MPCKIRNKMGNKRRRLAAAADVQQEAAVKRPQHSRVIHSSGQSVASTSHSIVTTLVADPLFFTPCGRLLSEMDNLSAISYSTDSGENGQSNITNRVNDNSSYEIGCHPPSDDGDLLGAINSESSYEAVALLTSQSTFTQDGLNQALISACRRGHKLLVQTLVRVGANIEHRDEHGNTPLLICAENDFTDIVRFLISSNANVSAVNSVGNTTLILSVHSSGSTDLTRFLLEQRDVDVHHENQHGHTALNRATQFMDVDTMRLLLEKSMRKKCDGEYRKVVLCEYDTDNCFFNSRSQEIKQQATVDKTGLGGVYEILQEHLITGTSLLDLAIKAGDTKSLDMLIDCQFSSREEKKIYVDGTLKSVFESQQHDRGQRFSSTDVKIIQKLLQYGADVNQYSGTKLLISLAVESGNFQVVELLCTHGAEMKGHYSREDPLVIAARIGRQDLIELLLKFKADIDWTDFSDSALELLLKYKADIDWTDFSDSALDCALRNDHTECAKLLIQRGAKMDVRSALISAVDHQVSKYTHFLFENYNREIMDYFLRTPLEARFLLALAAKKGNCEIIGRILDAGIDINEADSTGQTPLMASKNREVAEFLIQRGADISPEIEGINGSDTVLSHVIKNSRYNDKSTAELCKFLIDNGASVNCRSGGGKTPLMIAACQGDCVEMLQMLLDNGADVNDKNNEGNTALFYAVWGDISKNVTCLVDNRALVNCRNGEGKTPLMIAAYLGDCVDMLQILLDNGADVNDTDCEGNTALFYAVSRANSKNVTCLIDCSRDKKNLINIQNKEGITPLILSAQKRNVPIVKELLENGADVNIKDNRENTALHHFLVQTSDWYQMQIGTFLLKAGSHVNWQNSDGLSPLMLAAKNRNASLMSPLLEAGADVNAVSKKNSSQTALSFVPDMESSLEIFTRLCIETLLDGGAICSYLTHEYIHKLIIESRVNIILKLIHHGLGPADVHLRIGPSGTPSTVSPLCVALLHGKVDLARYFVDILFLTSSDLSMFASNKVMQCLLQREDRMDSLRFLQEVSSQPMSLNKLCLVAVSAAVGSSPGRETRVDSLPLPQMMKDRLLFKSVGDEHDGARLVKLLKDLGNVSYLYEDKVFHSSDSDDDSYD